MEESPQQQVLKLPLPPLPTSNPQFVTPQVLADVVAYAESEEAEKLNAAIASHCAEAVRRDIVESDFKEFEIRVAAATPAELKAWQDKLEKAAGVPPDLRDRGMGVITAQLRKAGFQ